MEKLKNLLNQATKKLNYKNKAGNYFKIENGFFKLINLQNGAYGNYYFINIGLHPIELPQLSTEKLILSDHYTHSQCIINNRIEQLINNPKLKIFKEDFVYSNNEKVFDTITKIITEDVENWFNVICDYKYILNMKDEELTKILRHPPLFKKKYLYMLKFYCALNLNENKFAYELYNKYLNEKINEYDFEIVDNYLLEMFNKHARSPS